MLFFPEHNRLSRLTGNLIGIKHEKPAERTKKPVPSTKPDAMDLQALLWQLSGATVIPTENLPKTANGNPGSHKDPPCLLSYTSCHFSKTKIWQLRSSAFWACAKACPTPNSHYDCEQSKGERQIWYRNVYLERHLKFRSTFGKKQQQPVYYLTRCLRWNRESPGCNKLQKKKNSVWILVSLQYVTLSPGEWRGEGKMQQPRWIHIAEPPVGITWKRDLSSK